MNDADILEYAYTYGKARLKVLKIYDESDKIDGLDEFHPKAVKWENKLYKAEQAKDKAKEILLEAAMEWSKE